MVLLVVAIDARAQDFTYTTNDGTITITGYYGPIGDVTIPSVIHGFPVTDIGSRAFSYWGQVINVTIPGSVTHIEEEAFYSCWSLAGVTIPGSVSYFGIGAVGNCSGLTSVSIPGSVPVIPDGAFANCYSLVTIQVGRAVLCPPPAWPRRTARTE